MVIQLIMLELILGVVILSGLIALGKTTGERICRFATIPVAYLIAFLLTKFGALDALGALVSDLLMDVNSISSMVGESMAAKTAMEGVIVSVIRVFLMVPIFWIVLALLRIILRIVLRCTKAREKWGWFQKENTKTYPVWQKILTCAIGVVGGYAILMLSLLPLNYLTGLVDPMAQKVAAESYNGTYIQEVVTTAQDLLPTGKQTICGKIQTYTGVGGILRGTASSLSNVTLTNNTGKKVDFNAYKMLQGLVEDGADAAVLYEYTCKPSQHTIADLNMVSSIIAHVSEYDALLEIGAEVLGSMELVKPTPGEEASFTDELLKLLQEEYAGKGGDALKNDLSAVAELLTVMTDGLGTSALDTEALLPDAIAFLANADNAYRVTKVLSKMNAYKETFPMLTEYGVGILCEVLELSSDRQAYYEKYLNDLQGVLNDRGEGTYDDASVELFIRYAVEENLAIFDFTEGDNAELNLAYAHYKRYLAHQTAIETFLCDYYLDSASKKTYYTAQDGTIFAYDKKADKWEQTTDTANLKASSLVVQKLSTILNERFEANAGANVSQEDIVQFGNQIVPSVHGAAADVAKTWISIDTFNPNVVYTDALLQKINHNVSYGENENRQFANLLSTAAAFFQAIDGAEDGSMMTVVMDNFHLAGRLVDNLQAFEMTKELPEHLLLAITQSREYGKYFVAESMAELSQNVKDGKATYEQLFTSVQALYGMINQFIPLS